MVQTKQIVVEEQQIVQTKQAEVAAESVTMPENIKADGVAAKIPAETQHLQEKYLNFTAVTVRNSTDTKLPSPIISIQQNILQPHLKLNMLHYLKVNSADSFFSLTTYQGKFSALYLFLVLQALTVLAA